LNTVPLIDKEYQNYSEQLSKEALSSPPFKKSLKKQTAKQKQKQTKNNCL